MRQCHPLVESEGFSVEEDAEEETAESDSDTPDGWGSQRLKSRITRKGRA